MRSALILNFTGNTYHYGCYGTSFEIYQNLLEKGYCVNYSTVRATHALPLTPRNGDNFVDQNFANQYMKANSPLTLSIEEADLVVVNGEGTLHRISNGSLSLLYQIFFSTQVLKKETYLVNHSVFPTGTTDIEAGVEGFYKFALQGVKKAVPREGFSREFYKRIGVNTEQGFDSLPLYIKRMGLLDNKDTGKEKTILLCGGIDYKPNRLKAVCNTLKKLKNVKFEFLLGGKGHLAPEEEKIFKNIKASGLKINLVQARTFEEWVKTIADASLLISGRFHYSVAALALSTPCLSFPSNTPKVEGIYRLLELDGCLDWADNDFCEKLNSYIDRGLGGELVLSDDAKNYMFECAANNYSCLPEA